jgi:polyhydroxybutyrate depolymerase
MKAKNYLLILALYASSHSVAQITITDSILSGGVYRTYVLYVPAIYNSANPVPLVFNLHGGTGDGNQQMQFGDFRPIADTANFIVVQPTALGGSAPYWRVPQIHQA